ncbi:putative pentatricopeptide repeat-containing protein At3g15130 [Selaginella moellendorffii]|uniref:putative pentatricopeptide repeat-containing protein At3g15130 n=1 Tax=Selaginella moellendorffii TaxID=88036 RepID=UPI000D1C569A|nr:putative pentatricopeptide repeat-containing protein At3g15130 [Selaginella moellendorffii]|eukprot:XP_024522170.1 putative pentatricopeptide repeat-containing protein At3g15130 [Selaginella moellendorffii]
MELRESAARQELGIAGQKSSMVTTNRSWLLAASKACSDSDKARQIHSAAVASGHDRDVVVSSALVTMYAKCGALREACTVFHSIPSTARDVVSWTALMLAHASNGAEELALQIFATMIRHHCAPDAQSFVVALKACTKLAAKESSCTTTKMASLERGMALHCQAAKSGCELHLFVASTLVDMYSKCGCMEEAARVFERMPARNVVSWTALIHGYASNGDGLKSLELLERMIPLCRPNSQTIVAALKACSSLAAQEQTQPLMADSPVTMIKVAALARGFAIHSRLIQPAAVDDVLVANTLLDLYAKCGSMSDAQRVFDSIPSSSKTVVSWNALMLGYVHNGSAATALDAFARMPDCGLEPDAHTFAILVNACGSCAAVELGRFIHREASRLGVLEQLASASSSSSIVVANSLVDFYAKCGSLDHAQALLDSCANRDVVTWSALLDGYARLGDMDLLLASLRQMLDEGLEPSSVTFLSLLTACSHAGLVERCKQVLAKIPRNLRSLEHYHILIDALGRANQLGEALTLVEAMPFDPDPVTWLTLLSAARKWNNLGVASLAFQMLVAIDRDHAHAASAYVLMANTATIAGKN